MVASNANPYPQPGGTPSATNIPYAPNGVGTTDVDTANQSGYTAFTPTTVTDPNYTSDRDAVRARMDAIALQPTRQAAGVNIGPAAQAAAGNQDPQAQFRAQQLALAGQLQAQANGTGPSVAGAQLQQSTEQNLQAALAQSASGGGNAGAAQYALGMQRANITQQSAQQLAQNRMQEQMNAQQQLGGVLQNARGTDVDVAGMQQQNNQFNTGQTNTQSIAQGGFDQNTQNANLGAGITQDQSKNDQLNKLLAMGYTMDQANVMLGIGQAQFTAQQLNTANAAHAGVGVQQSGQTMQAAGAAASTVGSIAASAAAAAA